jgi:hypothetical protein
METHTQTFSLTHRQAQRLTDASPHALSRPFSVLKWTHVPSSSAAPETLSLPFIMHHAYHVSSPEVQPGTKRRVVKSQRTPKKIGSIFRRVSVSPVCREVSLLVNKKIVHEISMVLWWRCSARLIIHVNTYHDPVAKQARANELIAEGDGYSFIAAPRSPDLRHTSKRRRHLCYCGNE